MKKNFDLSQIGKDLPASWVVFFVAVPLCLGIALASGAPLMAGLIAGILGGIVTGILSGSPLSVTGPAAGLSSIVLTSITKLGTFEVFLASLVLAGIIQLALGFLKAGSLGYLFPSSVIKGMLAGIGVILILKQIPHALGDDKDYEGDESFFQPDQQNTFTELVDSALGFAPGALLISMSCLAILLIWQRPFIQGTKWLRVIPGPILSVFAGVGIHLGFERWFPSMVLAPDHLVQLPDFSSAGLLNLFTLPDSSGFTNPQLYITALTVAVVASLETLLSIDASDKMDPHRRTTPLNQELKAQGITNILSGLIGGLPVTSVIVRTSTNVNAGAQTRTSAILHGVWLMLIVFAFPSLLELIPLSALAAILLLVGFKLASPVLWREQWKQGYDQFIPFVVTLIIIVFSDLLLGVFVGLLSAVFFVLKSNHQSSLIKVNQGNQFLVKFTKDVSFLNKGTLMQELASIPSGSTVLIEGGSVQFFDHDILEVLDDFVRSAPSRQLTIEIRKAKNALHPYFKPTE